MSDIVEIASVAEFIQKLPKQKRGFEFFYRGEAEDFGDTSNIPSIFRNKNLIEDEHNLFKDFIVRNPDEFQNEKTTFQKLVKMQHYELPTRLLDVTSNSLISLYFACKDSTNQEDSYVYIFKVQEDDIKFYDSDIVDILSNIATAPLTWDKVQNIKMNQGLFSMYSKRISNLNNRLMQDKTYIDNDEYYLKIDEIQKSHNTLNLNNFNFGNYSAVEILGAIDKIVLVKPLLSNRRIIMQSGAFFLFGIGEDLYTSLKLKPTYKMRIKASEKSKILADLERMGVSQDRIFPEMDKVAGYLKAKYS